MHRRHTKPIDLMLIMMFSISVFFILTTCMYGKNIELISTLSNRFYSDNALQFWVQRSNYDVDILYSMLPNNTILYNNLSLDGKDIRGVLFRGNVNKPQISEGRFFKEEDFQNNMRLAVVGCDVELNIRNDGQKYILYNNEEYDVIGIIQYNMPTKLDRTVLITSTDENLESSTEFIIDGPEIKGIYDFLANESVFGEIIAKECDNFNILRLIDRNNNAKFLALFFIIALLINCILILMFWVKSKENEIIIKKQNGFLSWQVLYDLEKEVIVRYIISSVLGILGLLGINVLFKYELLSLTEIIAMFWGIMLFYACFTILLAWPLTKGGKVS